MAYDMYYSDGLRWRLDKANSRISIFFEGDPGEDPCRESVDEVIPDISGYVHEGDRITFADIHSEDEDSPEYEFTLHTGERYLGAFDFEGEDLNGVPEETDTGVAGVKIMVRDGDTSYHIGTLDWVTVDNDAEREIRIMLERWRGSRTPQPISDADREECMKLLTHKPVFSTPGREKKEYEIILGAEESDRLPEDTEWTVMSENSETAIYDWLRGIDAHLWVNFLDGDELWSEGCGPGGSDDTRVYVFSRDSAGLIGSPSIGGRTVFCRREPDSQTMASVFLPGKKKSVGRFCVLMPRAIAEERILDAVRKSEAAD